MVLRNRRELGAGCELSASRSNALGKLRAHDSLLGRAADCRPQFGEYAAHSRILSRKVACFPGNA